MHLLYLHERSFLPEVAEDNHTKDAANCDRNEERYVLDTDVHIF